MFSLLLQFSCIWKRLFLCLIDCLIPSVIQSLSLNFFLESLTNGKYLFKIRCNLVSRLLYCVLVEKLTVRLLELISSDDSHSIFASNFSVFVLLKSLIYGLSLFLLKCRLMIERIGN